MADAGFDVSVIGAGGGQMGAIEVYVALLEEGTPVWRPVPAEPLGDGVFRLAGLVPADELWEFQPGETVRCVERVFQDSSRQLVAVERVSI